MLYFPAVFGGVGFQSSLPLGHFVFIHVTANARDDQIADFASSGVFVSFIAFIFSEKDTSNFERALFFLQNTVYKMTLELLALKRVCSVLVNIRESCGIPMSEQRVIEKVKTKMVCTNKAWFTTPDTQSFLPLDVT